MRWLGGARRLFTVLLSFVAILYLSYAPKTAQVWLILGLIAVVLGVIYYAPHVIRYFLDRRR